MRDLARAAAAPLRGLARDSLYRNSLYLLLNLGLNSVAGFAFVLICNRMYGKEAFGYAAALLALMGLAVSIANLGMNRTSLRFLGQARDRSAEFTTMAIIATGAGLLVGAALAPFFPAFGIAHSGALLAVLFVASVVTGCARGICDNAFIAIRAASGTLASNAVFNVLKLALPVALVGLGFVGVFASVVLAAAAASLLALLLLSRAGFHLGARPRRAHMAGRWRFALGTHAYELLGNATVSLVPLVVLARLGPGANSEWYVVMQIVTLLLMICSAINNAMFAELASGTGTTRAIVLRTLGAMYAVLTPLVLVVLVVAPQLLGVFGDDFRHAAPVLRAMALFALIGVVNYIAGSYLSLHKHVVFITVVNFVNAAVVLAYGMLVATTLFDIAIGWMLGEAVNLVLFVVGAAWIYRRRDRAAPDGLADPPPTGSAATAAAGASV